MSLEYIRDTYRVPARLQGRVEYTGGQAPRLGTIVGVDGAHLCIMLDGEKRARRYHPTWELRYLPDAQAKEGGA